MLNRLFFLASTARFLLFSPELSRREATTSASIYNKERISGAEEEETAQKCVAWWNCRWLQFLFPLRQMVCQNKVAISSCLRCFLLSNGNAFENRIEHCQFVIY